MCRYRQVPCQEWCRYPQVPCQEWCRYPAGALSGVVQVPAGALSGVVHKLAYRVLVSQGASLGDILLAPACPIEKVTLWVGFLY